MSEFLRRLVVPIACFVLMLTAGIPALVTAPTAPIEAAGSGVAVLALAALLRRTNFSPVRAGAPVRLVSQPAARIK